MSQAVEGSFHNIIIYDCYSTFGKAIWTMLRPKPTIKLAVSVLLSQMDLLK
jgi:hypothetical protein